MSPLASVRALIDFMTPLHEAQERGLSERTIERVYQTLLGVEAYLENVEAELEYAQVELPGRDEAPSRKPPL